MLNLNLLKHNMKIRTMAVCLLTASYGMGYSQVGSLLYDKVYDGSGGRPMDFAPIWNEHSVNGDNIKVSQGNKLSVSIGGNSSWNALMFLPDTFSVPFTAEYSLDDIEGEGTDFDIRTAEGKRFSFTLQQTWLIDRMSGDTLRTELPALDRPVYRFAVSDDDKLVIYRSGEEVSQVAICEGDTLMDPGFENLEKPEPIWWWASWSQLTVDTSRPHSGKKSLHWENGWTGDMGAHIPVQPNAKYKLSYYAKAERVNAWQSEMKGTFTVGGVKIASVNIPVGEYQLFTVEFTTGPVDETAELRFHNGWDSSESGAFAVFIDDVQLERVEAQPYVQFGRKSLSGESRFGVHHVALRYDAALQPAVFTDLTELCAKAQAAIDEAVVGEEIGNYPDYAVAELKSSLEYAADVEDGAGYVAIDSSYAALSRDMEIFGKCKITDTELSFSEFSVPQLDRTLRAGESLTIVPTGKMSNGEEIDNDILRVEYKSENGLFEISEDGYLTALSSGSDFLVVNARYINASEQFRIPVNIETYQIESVSAETYETKLLLGDATGIKVDVVMTGGKAPEAGEVQLSYESLTPDVAEVNSNGSVIAKGAGKAVVRVTATFMGENVSADVECDVVKIESISLEAPLSMEVNEHSEYAFSGFYSDGTEFAMEDEDVVVWSSDRSVLKMDDSGNIVGAEPGETMLNVRVNQGGVQLKKSVAVKVEVPLSISDVEEADKNGCRFSYNPDSKTVTVVKPSDCSASKVSIYSSSGLRVRCVAFDGDRAELSVAGLLAGVYAVAVDGIASNSVKLTVSQGY